MCIRDSLNEDDVLDGLRDEPRFRQLVKDAEELSLAGFPSLGARLLRSQMIAEGEEAQTRLEICMNRHPRTCLLDTSDAADGRHTGILDGEPTTTKKKKRNII